MVKTLILAKYSAYGIFTKDSGYFANKKQYKGSKRQMTLFIKANISVQDV